MVTNEQIGDMAKELREAKGWTIEEAAAEFGCIAFSLEGFERGLGVPSKAILDSFSRLYGIDPYVAAWCRHGDMSKLPRAMQLSAKVLTEGWQENINALGN